MKLLLTIKDQDHKKSVQSVIEHKLSRLTKYISENIKVSWIYFTEGDMHLSEVRVSGFHGPAVLAHAHSHNPYKVIDLAINKIERQLSRRHERKKIKGSIKLNKLTLNELDP